MRSAFLASDPRGQTDLCPSYLPDQVMKTEDLYGVDPVGGVRVTQPGRGIQSCDDIIRLF